MATNKQDDKALTDDQAFIQSLYDDLSDSQGENPTVQPSEQLDQRIIAAAHKAVATKATTTKAITTKAVATNPAQQIDEASSRETGDNIPGLNPPANNKRKKMAWYYPAAMAASVLLVVTMVNHQLSDPINPAYQAPLVSMDNMSRSEQSESLAAPVAKKALRTASEQTLRSFAAQLALTDKMLVEELVEESDDAFFESGQTLIASVEAPVLADKKAFRNGAVKLQSKAEKATEPFSKTIQQSADAGLVMAAKVKAASSVKGQQLSEEKLNSLLSPTALSHEEYIALQAQSQQETLYWLLQQDNDSSYVIELFKTEQSSLFYRLNKNDFQLNKSIDDKKLPFAEIIYME